MRAPPLLPVPGPRSSSTARSAPGAVRAGLLAFESTPMPPGRAPFRCRSGSMRITRPTGFGLPAPLLPGLLPAQHAPHGVRVPHFRGSVRGGKWRSGRIVPPRTRPRRHQNRGIMRKPSSASEVQARTILPERQNRDSAGPPRSIPLPGLAVVVRVGLLGRFGAGSCPNLLQRRPGPGSAAEESAEYQRFSSGAPARSGPLQQIWTTCAAAGPREGCRGAGGDHDGRPDGRTGPAGTCPHARERHLTREHVC